MTSKFQPPEITPAQALDNIRERLYKAVDEGKKKAGVAPRTEAVLEGVDNSDDDEYGDDLDFSELSEPDVQQPRVALEPNESPDDEYGDNLSLDMLDETGEDSSSEKSDAQLRPAITKRPNNGLGAPTTVTVSHNPNAFDIAPKTGVSDYASHFMSSWMISAVEIRDRLKSLFQYAAENREYLTDAGPLITEPEMLAIFFAEYRNYIEKERNGEIIEREHKGATDKVIHAIPEIVNEKSRWLLAQFNERLHGQGNFLESGSLMHYLIRIGHQRITRNAQLSNESLAPAGEEGLCNFIIARNLQSCKQFVSSKMGSADVPESAKTGLALDILTNGTNKPEILRKIGGVGSKMYASPRYGSVERKGDDICIVGSQQFLSEFLTRFNSFNKTLGEELPAFGEVEPATDKYGAKRGRGLYMVRFPETPYLEKLNESVKEGIFIPIQFGVGTVSLTGGGSGEGAEGESRYSDILQTHQSTDSSDAVDYSVGENLSANNLMNIMEKPGFGKLVERYDVKELSDAAKVTNGFASTVKLSKLVATLLGKIADRNGIPCAVEKNHGIYVAKLGTDKSLAAIAANKEGISSQERSTIVGLLGYNNYMLTRVDSMNGNDVSDLGSMKGGELKRSAIPTVHLGKLGELCLSGDYNDPNTVAFAKGYLINALGGVVGFTGSDGQIFSSAADFAKTTHSQKVNADIIKQEIASLDAQSLPAYAQLFETKAEDHVGHDEDDEPEGGWFYDSRKMVTLDKVSKTPVARAIEFIIPGVTGDDVVMGAIETVGGLEKGYLSKYMDAIMNDDGAVVSAMAGDIVNSAGDVISVNLSNTAAETIQRDTSSKEKTAARRKSRRGTWFD